MSTVTGGDKTVQYLRKIAKQISGGTSLRVGFLAKAKYPDGTSVALVAALNEYGHRDRAGNFIGPWPFFRTMVATKQHEWPQAFKWALNKTNYDLVAAYKIMGEGIKGQLQESIRATMAPALKESTIRAKGFSKPMINTGHMLNSVDYKISKEK